MTTVKVNLFNGSSSFSGLAGFNELSNFSATGQVIADLTDVNGSSTGFSLNVDSAFNGDGGSGGFATSSPDADFPVEFFQAIWTQSTSNPSPVLRVATGLSGVAYTLKIAGQIPVGGRDTTYDPTNSSPATDTYVVADTNLDPVPAPVSFTGTADGSGDISITLTGASVDVICNGFLLDVTENSTATAGIPATVLENADGTLDTGRAVTRTITRVSDSTQLFTGSQTSDGTTAELPSIDLSATSAATGEAVDDRIVQSTPTNPSAAAVTIRRNVEDIS